MSFEPNVGQADDRVRFLSRGPDSTVFLTEGEAVISLTAPARPARAVKSTRKAVQGSDDAAKSASLRMRFDGATSEPRLLAEKELQGRVNDLRGTDPANWRSDIPTFGAVRYEAIYEGIDAVFYGTSQQLEYDIVVRPGADVSSVRVRFDGQDSAEVTPDGDLVLRFGQVEVHQMRPVVYQSLEGGKRPVASRHVLDGDGGVRFDVGEYDRTQPLVVDPVLTWVVIYGGGQKDDRVQDIALTSDGKVIAVGETHSREFPTTPDAYDTTFNPTPFPSSPSSDAFVTKLSADGSSVLFSTFLGGSLDDAALAVTIAGDSTIVVGGTTQSADFPVTAGAFDTTFAGGDNDNTDAFIVRLDATGSVASFSTFVGGTADDSVHAVRTDSLGRINATGITWSSNFPVTAGVFQPTSGGGFGVSDGFVARLSANGATMDYSSYLGGSSFDGCYDIHVDPDGSAYVVGQSSSMNFPTTPGAYDTTPSGNSFVVAKVSPTGQTLTYSTFAGSAAEGESEANLFVKDGCAFFTGTTDSASFPVTAGAYDTTYNSTGEPGDAVVVKLSDDGTALLFATYLGGQDADRGDAISVDASGAIYVVGSAESTDFPTTPGAYQPNHRGGLYDGFVTKLTSSGDALVSSTFIGGYYYEILTGIEVDASGAVYVGGYTASFNFPVTSSAFDRIFNGDVDAFVFKLNPTLSSLSYSTLLDGPAEDSAAAMHVEPNGELLIVGSTPSFDFPVCCGDFPFDATQNGQRDAFVVRYKAFGSPSGTSGPTSTTFLGGAGDDAGTDITFNADRQIVVVGSTGSSNFPVTPGAYDSSYGGLGDAFVAILSEDCSQLVASSYLGETGADSALCVDTDAQRTVYVGGRTSSAGFPTTAGTFDATIGGSGDGFLVRFNSSCSALLSSTFFGGSGSQDAVDHLVVSPAAEIVVAGSTDSADFPTTAGAFDQTLGGSTDAFVARLDVVLSALASSTLLGGSANETVGGLVVDLAGDATVCGGTSSPDFPVTAGAFDTTRSGATDCFVTRFNPTGSTLQFSTLLGGSGDEFAGGLAVDSDGTIYVGGDTSSTDFPTGGGAPGTIDSTYNGGGGDGFVTLLSPTVSNLVSSTYVGGDGLDKECSIGINGQRNVVLVGQTASFELPDPIGNFHTGTDVFVALLEFPAPLETGLDTVGVYVASTGTWFVRYSTAPGAADRVFSFGPGGPGFLPLVGDWDGDGDDTPGIYQISTGAFFLKNDLTGGNADLVFTYGAGGAGVRPVIGDWDADGDDTVGIYFESNGAFLLRNDNSPGPADLVFTFGPGGPNFVPIAGPWAGGSPGDGVGIYARSTGAFFLKDFPGPGPADRVYTFGPPNATPLSGKWTFQPNQYVGVYIAGTATWFLRNSHAPGPADLAFTFGPPDVVPVVGNWAGR